MSKPVLSRSQGANGELFSNPSGSGLGQEVARVQRLAVHAAAVGAEQVKIGGHDVVRARQVVGVPGGVETQPHRGAHRAGVDPTREESVALAARLAEAKKKIMKK